MTVSHQKNKGGLVLDTKDKIVQAAMECISEHGFEKTTVSKIVEQAGVAQGTFYIYFDQKNDILKDIMDEISRDVEQAIKNRIEEDDNPIEKIHKSFKVAYNVFHQYKDMTISMQSKAIILEMQHYTQQLARKYTIFLSKWIEEGKKQGLFEVDDASTAAFFIVSLYETTAYCSLHDEELDSFDDIYNELLKFIDRGLGYKGSD